MGLAPQIKCGRCDKLYSRARMRCPHCGARRGKGGKHTTGSENFKGKAIIGLLLIGILVIAVAVLLIASIQSAQGNPAASPPPSAAPSALLPGGDDVDITTPEPPPVPDFTPTPEPPIQLPTSAITLVEIRFAGSIASDFTESVGTTIPLKATVTPADTGEVPVWTSSNSGVFNVVPTDTTGMSANVTITGTGSATLTVTVGDKTAECLVRGSR